MIKIKRPLLIILVGAIIGIIYGLYLNISIAITIILLALLLYLIQKNKKKAFYFFTKRKIIILIFLISIISFSLYIILLNSQYEKIYNKIPENTEIIATIISEAKETEYYNSYEIKVNNKKFLLYAKKNFFPKLEYGMKVKIEAEYSKPQEARNYKGFSYKNYLKTKKIYGSFKAGKIEIIEKNRVNKILLYSNKMRNKIIKTIKQILPEETQGLMLGMLIGENSEIQENITESFSKSSLSHIVAISGSHITYIILGISFVLTKSKVPKRGINILTIIALIIFMFLTRFSASVVRACIMGIVMLFSKVVYRKLDILNSIALSLIIILINNPYAIGDVGLQLSYFGTLGIIILNKPISNFLEKYMNKKIVEILSVTISAQIVIMPIMIFKFNTISTVFIISNLIAVPLSGVITLYGYANVFIGMVSLKIGKIIGIILNLLVKMLIWIAETTAKIPFATITTITPSVISIILYYIVLWKIYKKRNLKKIIYVIVSYVVILTVITYFPKQLTINFIDVGQRR